jgi:hypothetical protein
MNRQDKFKAVIVVLGIMYLVLFTVKIYENDSKYIGKGYDTNVTKYKNR